MFEIGPDLTAVEEAVILLKNQGFTEFYMFGRIGIPTTYIVNIGDCNILLIL